MTTWGELHDHYRNQTCVVIGNGPSLNDIPLSFLRKYPTFGTNRIYLREGFTPTFYACVNPLVAEQYLFEICAMQADVKFITEQFVQFVHGALPLHSIGLPIFSQHPEQRVFEGFTVTYVCLQLAYYLGFARVLLVGVDHSYKFEGQPNEERTMRMPDPNHFAPEYFQGARWNNPDLTQSERAYRIARTVYERSGREILNCTTRTALEVFPKADWREYA